MRPLALVFVLAASASANPMLEKCVDFAPKICGLTKDSTQAEFLDCFKEPGSPFIHKPGAAECREELAHARVHAACDAVDVHKVCAGVEPGNGKLMGCLRKNKKKLTKDCREGLRDYDALQSGQKKRSHAGVAAVRC